MAILTVDDIDIKSRMLEDPARFDIWLERNLAIIREELMGKNFFVEVQKGNIPGHSLVHKFGAVEHAGAGWEVVASAHTYQTPIALTSLEISSDDNINDIPAGTGALSVKVIGIGPGWIKQEEIIPLNGTTWVPLTKQFYRVYRLKVYTTGTYAIATASSHNSTITVRATGPGATWAQLVPETTLGLGQSEIGAFTIDKGYYGLLISRHVDISDIGANKVGDIALFVRENADDIVVPFSGVMRAISIERDVASGAEITIDPKSPILALKGPADIGVMANSATPAKIETDFEILMIEEQYYNNGDAA